MTHTNSTALVNKPPSYRGFVPASDKASRIKSKTPSKNTRAELILRRELWRRGLRYRLHAAGLPGKPDIVFPGRRVVVYVDGDFWHGRNWNARREKLLAGTNPAYWIPKIESNMSRDLANATKLQEAGWTVVRLWETDIKRDVSDAADRVSQALGVERESK